MELFDNSFTAIGLALNAAGLRQQVLANNLANVNTPGFKRSDVNFDEKLTKALEAASDGSAADLDSLTPTVEPDNVTTMRIDGNNVDVDIEMSDLAENNIRYNALVQLAAKHLNQLQYIISDGRR